MSLLSFPPRTNQQLDSRAGETLPHRALAEGEASCLGRFVMAPPPLAFIKPKLVTPHQVVVQVDQNEAQLLQQLPSAHTHTQSGSGELQPKAAMETCKFGRLLYRQEPSGFCSRQPPVR